MVHAGFFHLQGKAAFDREIENNAFSVLPVITISGITEENDVVIAAARVQAHFRNGNLLDALF
ncbi:hypothetical protein A8C56_14965 [Niabella ginsenosidivorans]|uniref:Uncharacterized protein n=1 Tax=Niabella ginsenosidivorans TaxID=1176587 RepID=A0A1A9I5Y6_9BACT|nr:hypothetical protein [Niabella ginsenosidivorans]ANH82101.1 hypothetical protein A8C56_14965 [Niabella ginsenosidivorans]